jgi:hypothetical protein
MRDWWEAINTRNINVLYLWYSLSFLRKQESRVDAAFLDSRLLGNDETVGAIKLLLLTFIIKCGEPASYLNMMIPQKVLIGMAK